MKKIYIEKSDAVSSVIERAIAADDKELILYIPRFSKFASSPNNLRLLARELGALNKKFEIESVDEDILQIAKSLDIKSSNPFFKKGKKQVSDILLPRTNSMVNEIPVEVGPDERAEELKAPKRERNYHTPSLKERLIKVGVILAIIMVVFGAAVILPRAHITVALDKINWDFSGSVLASSNIKTPTFASGQFKVGGVVLDKTKNMTKAYPATGSKNVSTKASGTITIFNAYSSDPQPLVLNTRFSSPEGKIFRILKGITIPGAKIVDNKIVPSTIDVTVVADAPGEAYNIAPGRFRIPGFQGSPRYEGFYAESSVPMKGGFVGVAKVPTDSDLKSAKDDIRKSLENILRSETLLGIPEGIEVIDGATKFVIVKEAVDEIADSSGNFGITLNATLRLLGFNKSDLIAVMRSEVANKNPLRANGTNSLIIKESASDFGEPRIDFDKGEMSVALKFRSIWVHEFSVDDFKDSIKGHNKTDLGVATGGASGIKSVRVELWPFWVRSIPSKTNKIRVDVE